ncbi:MAG: permease [Chlamydiia bacterium]|nr:permease [Chlamydiia bacterium]
MRQESIGFSVIKLLVGTGILILLGMVYWSSLLIEEDLKQLTAAIRDLRQETEGIRGDTLRLRKSLNEQIDSLKQPAAGTTGKENPETTFSLSTYRYMDPKLPNLLEKDPFYTTTLPQMLGEDFRPHGTRREARLGRPENLHPFNSFSDVVNLLNMTSGSVSQLAFGKYETMSPSFAVKMEARAVPGKPTVFEYWVFLRDDLFWEPLKQEHFPEQVVLDEHFLKRHPVTAYDFKFFYDASMNPNIEQARASSLRAYFSDIEKFKVIDSLTFYVRWKSELVYDVELGQKVPKVRYSAKGMTGSLQPLPRFVFQYFPDGKKIIEDDTDFDTYQVNSVWAQNFNQHWAKNILVSCGPWTFGGMSEEGVFFKRNSNFYNPYAVLVDGFLTTFKESLDGVWQDFKAGKTDMIILSPNQLPEYEAFLKSSVYLQQKKKGMAIQELEFVNKAYYYIGWNQTKLFFKEKIVRKALTLAIDRNRIIAQNLNDMGVPITGPFYKYSPAYDASLEALPFDPDEARRLLDLAGWIDMDGDGIRDKVIEGKRIPFSFTLTYFSKNFTSKVISEYIATALREVGVQCKLNGVDLPDLSRSFEDQSFDAIYLGWSLGTPPEEPRQIWHSQGAKIKGTSNAIAFEHQEADQLIEALEYEYNPEKRKALYHRFHQVIHDEVPYTFLYSPKTKLLYREYVKNLFIPKNRQDLVPGADISEPDFGILYFDHQP